MRRRGFLFDQKRRPGRQYRWKGESGLDRYFEGWFFKHRKGPETLSVIVGRAADGAFIQAVTGERAYRARYPLEAFEKGKTIRLADNYFSETGVRLSICSEGLELAGRIDYGGITPPNGDIMGPFRFLPMQCRHTVISMNHTLSGNVVLNGKDIDFIGGKGYIEGDSGRSFPKSYTWVQCNDFDRNCSIMASAAHIPFAVSSFWGCIALVWLDGAEYRLATYRGARIKRRDAGRLLLEQGDLSLDVRFLGSHAGHLLDAPERGQMKRGIHEVPAAPAYFEFRRGNFVLFQGESRFASYEHVNEPARDG